MFGLRATIAVAASVAILLTLTIAVIVRRCYDFSKRGTKVTEATATKPPLPPPQNREKKKFRQSQLISKIESRPTSNHPIFRRGSSIKPLFNWSDHPSLITDAVENGWSRFAFTNHSSSSSSSSYQSNRSTLLGLGCVGDLHHQHNQRESQVEITWEVRENSLDFMQKIRLNSGLKKPTSNSSFSSSMAAKSVIRTTLPLPGPPLGTTSSFPEEAYFEITILSVSSSSSSSSRNVQNRIEGEKTKLIQDKGLEGKSSKIHIATSKTTNQTSEEGKRTGLMMSVGLTTSSHLPLRIPGCYPASIGFNSDDSVYLDGIKLAFGSGKENWGQQKVIGCGFNPKQKKVFFTTNSVLTHMVNCKSDEFGSPLYPVIAANADVTVLVNMGQSRFSYEPANFTRTPNPCFIGSIPSSATTTGYEDSEELFSMGRIDSGWLNHSTTKSSTNSDVYSWCSGAYNNSSNNGSKLNQEDDESEADLFEIVLDVNGKSPIV